jgi:hypothetical protein
MALVAVLPTLPGDSPDKVRVPEYALRNDETARQYTRVYLVTSIPRVVCYLFALATAALLYAALH